MDFSDYARAQRPALMRFATVLTGQTWLADDLVSDALGKAFERWDAIGSMEYPHAYVRRMIVNEHVSWRRRLTRRAPESRLDDLTTTDGSAEHAERDAMIARLDRLPPRRRAAVVLRYYADLSDAEIAEILGCRVGTVRSQIARALAALRIEQTESDGRLAIEPQETR